MNKQNVDSLALSQFYKLKPGCPFTENLNRDGYLILKGYSLKLIDTVYEQSRRFFDSDRKRLYLAENPQIMGGYNYIGDNPEDALAEYFNMTSTRFSQIYQEEKTQEGQRTWQTEKDFPGFEQGLMQCMRKMDWIARRFCTIFLDDHVGYTDLVSARYRHTPEHEYKVPPHKDANYIITAKPEGEPLCLKVNGKESRINLANDEIAIIDASNSHWVSNTIPEDRYALIFSFQLRSEFPI
tara:strand:- start:5473 stop:6189 length:717 start_codon:yes stop_codon:yes gene_type:complete